MPRIVSWIKITIVPEFAHIFHKLNENKWAIAVMGNSLNINEDVLTQYGIDTSWRHSDVVERVERIRLNGEEVLFVCEEKIEFPSVAHYEMKNIFQSIAYAKRIDMLVKEHFRVAKCGILLERCWLFGLYLLHLSSL